jgi:hypothetical protein
MANQNDRLKLSAEILGLIERRRQETGDSYLGSDIERVVLESEWRDLERDIFDNPGALEAYLIPIRRRQAIG